MGGNGTAAERKKKAPKPGALKDQKQKWQQRGERESDSRPTRKQQQAAKKEKAKELKQQQPSRPKPEAKPPTEKREGKAKGRPMPQEVKDLPVAPQVNPLTELYVHNTYTVEPWFRADGKGIKWIIPTQGDRITVQKAAHNLPEHVAEQINSLFSGPRLPLAKGKNYQHVKGSYPAPATSLIFRNLMRVLCQVWRNRAAPSGRRSVGLVCVRGDIQPMYDALVATQALLNYAIVVHVYVMGPPPQLDRYQANKVQAFFRPIDASSGILTVDGKDPELETFPLDIISFFGSALYEIDDGGDRNVMELSPLTKVLVAAKDSHIIEVAPIKPFGTSGSFGAPVTEFKWNAWCTQRQALSENTPSIVDMHDGRESCFSMVWWRGCRYIGLGGVVIKSASSNASFVLGVCIVPPTKMVEDDWISQLSGEATTSEMAKPRAAPERRSTTHVVTEEAIMQREAQMIRDEAEVDRGLPRDFDSNYSLRDAFNEVMTNVFNWADNDSGPSEPPAPMTRAEEKEPEFDEPASTPERPPDSDPGAAPEQTVVAGPGLDSGDQPEPEESTDEDSGSDDSDSNSGAEALVPDAEGERYIESNQAPVERRTYAAVTGNAASQRGAHAGSGGRLDPVHPLAPHNQTRGGAREPTTRYVQAHGGRWFFTRQYVNWLYTNGFMLARKHPVLASVASCVGAATIARLLAHIPLFGNYVPDPTRLLCWAGGISVAGLALCTEFVPPDPQFECDSGPQVGLTGEQEGIITSMISRRVVEGRSLNPTLLASTLSDVGRAIGYQGNVKDLAPNVTHRWREIRRETSVTMEVNRIVLLGLCASEVAYRILSPIARAITRFRTPTVARADMVSRLFSASLSFSIPVTTMLEEKAQEHCNLPPMDQAQKSALLQAMDTIVCAPIVEEGIKMSAGCVIGQKKAAWIFGLIEMAHYAMLMTASGFSWQQILLSRIPPLFLHVATGHMTSYRNRVALHMAWNLFSVLGANFLPREWAAPASSSWARTVLTYIAESSDHVADAPLGEPAVIVCTAHRSVKDVRGGNTITMKTNVAKDCKVGKGYYRCGPTLKCYQPFSFSGCAHNCLNALTSRMAGIPAAFARDDSDEHRDRVDRYVAANALRTIPIVCALKGSFIFTLVGNDEWAARFPAHKSKMLLDAYHNAGKLRTEYKTFVKVEKGVVPEEDIEWLRRWCVDDRLSQPPDGVMKLDARGISVPDEAVRVETGPWCLGLNRALHEMFSGQIYYNPGSTPLGTSQWYNWAVSAVSGGTIPWAMAVQGDDSLLLYKEGEHIIFLSSDMSRYDMCQRVSHFRACWDFIERIGISCPDKVTSIIKRQQGLTGKQRVYHANTLVAHITGTMASGDGVTITFNSLTLILAIVGWVEARGTSFTEHMASLGFVVTYAHAVLDKPLEIDFLQSRPWLTALGDRVFGPKPGRILSRFFWIDKKYNSEGKYRTDARAMAYGLLSLSSHVPLINDICMRVLEISGDCRDRLVDDGLPLELSFWKKGSWESEHPDTVVEMSGLYGLVPSDIEVARKRCRTWSWGEHIDNTPELRRIFSTIASVDLS